MIAIIIRILSGALAGFIASKIQSGSSKGFIVNLFLGVIGAYVGGWLFDLFGITTMSFAGDLICAVIGAIIVLWVFSKMK